MRRHGHAWCIIALFLVLSQPSALTGETTRGATPRSIQAFVCKPLLLVCTVENRQVLLRLAHGEKAPSPTPRRDPPNHGESCAYCCGLCRHRAGVSWYKDQESQQEKITHLTIAVEGLQAGMKLQAERTDLLQKSLENLKEEGKKSLENLKEEGKKRLDEQDKKLDDQGKKLDQIFNMLKEKRGSFFRWWDNEDPPVTCWRAINQSQLCSKVGCFTCVTRAFADAETDAADRKLSRTTCHRWSHQWTRVLQPEKRSNEAHTCVATGTARRRRFPDASPLFGFGNVAASGSPLDLYYFGLGLRSYGFSFSFTEQEDTLPSPRDW